MIREFLTHNNNCECPDCKRIVEQWRQAKANAIRQQVDKECQQRGVTLTPGHQKLLDKMVNAIVGIEDSE